MTATLPTGAPVEGAPARAAESADPFEFVAQAHRGTGIEAVLVDGSGEERAEQLIRAAPKLIVHALDRMRRWLAEHPEHEQADEARRFVAVLEEFVEPYGETYWMLISGS